MKEEWWFVTLLNHFSPSFVVGIGSFIFDCSRETEVCE